MSPTPERLEQIADSLQGFAQEIRADIPVVTAPIVTPPPAMTPVLNEAKPGWKLVLNEQFDGTSGVAWRKGKPDAASGGHHGYLWDKDDKEVGYYLANRSVLGGGGVASISAIKKSLSVVANKAQQGKFVNGPIEDIFYNGWEAGVFQYQTGTITTGPDRNGMIGGLSTGDWTPKGSSFEFLYGQIEARIKLPKGKGLWPAFWLLRSDGVWPPEIDVLEVVDPNCKCVAQHYHYTPSNIDFTKNENLGYPTGKDLSTDFHTFSVDWQPEYIRWYIDGVLTQEFTDKANIANKPMYILLNLAIGGKWAGMPDASTVFPARMDIDYVKVWQKAA